MNSSQNLDFTHLYWILVLSKSLLHPAWLKFAWAFAQQLKRWLMDMTCQARSGWWNTRVMLWSNVDRNPVVCWTCHRSYSNFILQKDEKEINEVNWLPKLVWSVLLGKRFLDYQHLEIPLYAQHQKYSKAILVREYGAKSKTIYRFNGICHGISWYG